jgi:S-adenosylmethionine:tRNA-ribosyltransferase-isomerase (queuine synthetase)
MRYGDLKNKIIRAIKTLRKNDSHLLWVDSSERSIMHKLAIYLGEEFKEYDVDCEYNRSKDVPKVIMSKLLGRKNYSSLKKKVYPDIVIHKRGNNGDNLLVVEIKKSSNHSRGERDFDVLKLEAYMSKGDDYQYRYGMFVDIFVGDDYGKIPIVHIFKDWKKVALNMGNSLDASDFDDRS